MIKLYDALITQSLPDILGEQPWCIALAKVIRKQIRKTMLAGEKSRTYSAIDQGDHKVLDVLAAEMRTPGYSESFSLQVKRSLVKGTLAYYSHAGTAEALKVVCAEIFGDAAVLEWYEYNGRPGYFKITTNSPSVTDNTINEFIKTAERVKRLSAKLDGIEVVLSAKQEIFVAAVLHTGTRHTFRFIN